MDVQPGSDLLLQCLRDEEPQLQSERLGWFSPADWELTLAQAARHGLLPLLAGRLAALPGGIGLPEEARQRLQQALRLSAGRNLLLYHELGSVLGALRDAGVPAIVLKGAHLAKLVYQDIALRPMVDIDLLVPQEALRSAAEAVGNVGYKTKGDYNIEAMVTVMEHLPTFVKPGGAALELHWHIAQPAFPFDIQPESLWENARPAEIEGQATRVLCDEDLLLHIVLHMAYKHSFGLGLRPLVDVHTLLMRQRDTFDWEAFCARSKQCGLGKSAYLVLRLSQRLLNSPVEGQALEALQPADFDPQYLTRLSGYILETPPQVSPHLAAVFDARTPGEKIRRMLRRLFCPPHVIAADYNLPLGSPRVYLYYPLRLVTAVARHAGSALPMLRGEQAALVAARRQGEILSIREWLGAP